MPGYGLEMNKEVVALAMVETAAGVENLEAIAATPGLDGIYVGPSDLTLGTQQGRLPPGLDREEPEMIELLKRIAKVCGDNNIKASIHCIAPEYAARAVEWGFHMTTVSGDARLMSGAAAASIGRFRELTGTGGGKKKAKASKMGY